jgi:hypothetical protein
VLEPLTRPTASTLKQFLRAWHGDPSSPAAASVGEVPGFVPEPLRAFYRTTACWPEAVVQNRLLSADELRSERGRFVFYVENQATHLWGTEPALDDPPVWVIENEHGAHWQTPRQLPGRVRQCSSHTRATSSSLTSRSSSSSRPPIGYRATANGSRRSRRPQRS